MWYTTLYASSPLHIVYSLIYKLLQEESMGDRANVIVKTNDEQVCLYTHCVLTPNRLTPEDWGRLVGTLSY